MWRFIFSLTVVFFCSCRQDLKPIDDKLILSNEIGVHQMDTVVYDSLSKSYFSRLQKSASEGISYNYSIPKQFLEKELFVVIKGRARSNYPFSHGCLAFVAFDEWGQQLAWNAITIRPHLFLQNEWNWFNDSIRFPSLINNKKYTKIKAYPFLGNSPGELFDIDSFHVITKLIPEY